MSKRFGKARVPGCECEIHYTCGKCLADALPYYWTLDSGEQVILPRGQYRLGAGGEDG